MGLERITTFETAKIANIVGYKGEIILDKSKLDGTMRKKADNTKITKLGWSPKISFNDGLEETYSWYLENVKN